MHASESRDGRNDFDLVSYLNRIGLRSVPPPDLAALRELHVRHLESIPFENIDVRLGRTVKLDLGSLQDKLVLRRRGGYCFEQNALFAAALRAIGFPLTTLEARVRPPGAIAPTPRTHMALSVQVGGNHWLADVGFGADGPLRPVSLDDLDAGRPDSEHTITRESDDTFVLRSRSGDGWRDLYAFSSRAALPIDYVVANHFTSTYADSPFVKTLTVQRITPEARYVLRGRIYSIRRAGVENTTELKDAEIPELVRTVFGLEMPDEDILRALNAPDHEGR